MEIKSNQELLKAYLLGGYRERFAMDNGDLSIIYIVGRKCYRFTYSSSIEYQDANGATYDTLTQAWIN